MVGWVREVELQAEERERIDAIAKAGFNAGWNAAVEEAAAVAQSYFIGMFTGWKGHTGDSTITLDEAEDVVSECGPLCVEAIRKLVQR